MSEGERVGAWLALLFMVGLGGILYSEVTKNERMAKAGYMPLRLQGTSETYWLPNPDTSTAKELLGH